MPVETIECQIVQAQLARYLMGDALSPEVVSEIESHVAGCSLCRLEVADRRATLQSLLGGAPAQTTRFNTDILIDALREKTPTSHAVVDSPATQSAPTRPLTARNLSKPLMYGTALAVVLLGMSYFGKNPTSILGERAATTMPATVPSEPTDDATILAPESSEIVEPVGSQEWDEIGLGAWVPFEVELASLAEPWEWYALASSLEPYEDGDVVTSETDEQPDLSAAPANDAAQPTSEPARTQAPRVKSTTAKPAPKGPAASKPATIQPQVQDKAPENKVRVYAPNP